jgi:UDP-N-acetylmuramoylalanine--D-glutamate ligase
MGADVTIQDSREADGYDVVVRSPQVRPADIHTQASVTSAMKEFFARCPAHIIGIAGTQGKSTVAALVAAMLEAAGRRVWLGGYGQAEPLDFLLQVEADDVVVLELSTFELIDLDVSPHIGVCLMVMPEHLDWHHGAREYIAATGNLFWNQQPGDVALYNSGNDYSTQIALLSPGRRRSFWDNSYVEMGGGLILWRGQVVCRLNQVRLRGAHNLENIAAAMTAAAEIMGNNIVAMRQAITGFDGLPHRLAWVGTVGDVRYYDDSLSSAPQAAIAAIEAFAEPKVMIVGGAAQRVDFGDLARAVRRGRVWRVLLVGETGAVLAQSLREAGYEEFETVLGTMDEVVKRAHTLARPGDVVVFTPGAVPVGEYESYDERGDRFRAAVLTLSEVRV